MVTGSRADYGLLRWLMQEIKEDPDLELQILVTGMHLSETFGLTYQEIESDGFEINEKVVVLNDNDSGLWIAPDSTAGCGRRRLKIPRNETAVARGVQPQGWEEEE